MAQAAIPPVRRRIFAIVAAIVVSAALVMSGIGYAVWRLNDYLESSVSGPTGSGPCSSADAVDLQLISGDGKIVQACTRDRPACPSQSDTADTRFNMNSQLRSSARRYILLISLDAALPAESPEQTVTLHPGAGFMPESPPLASIASGLVQITPRDPMQDAVVTVSGSLTVASSQGVARGRMDGSFIFGTSANVGSLQRVAGTFACNR